MDKTAKQMVDFAGGLRFSDLPRRAVHDAKARVIDSLGVALAAYLAPPVRIARKMAVPIAGDFGARVFGTMVRTTPDLAAFVNGAMVRYLDLNDAYRTRDACHPSDNLAGLLALAEASGASGRDFILALAISYEIQCRYTDAVPFNDNGWDQPVVGASACALAAGRMLGLTRHELHQALALAVVPNLCTYVTRAGELSMWKGCAGPNGARHGIFAALLAREGMAGPYDPFEGHFGVWMQTLGKPVAVDLPRSIKGRTLGLSQSNIKRYAVRDSCQLPIDTARDLRKKIRAEDVKSLHIKTYKSAYVGAVADRELWAPKTRETADHSMLVSVACGLIDGDVTPETFSRERFLDADVLGLIKRTKVEVVDAFTKQTPGLRNCRLEATSKDGTKVVAHRKLSLKDIERGMSDKALEAKFHGLASTALGAAERRKLLAVAWKLDSLPKVDPLIDLLAI